MEPPVALSIKKVVIVHSPRSGRAKQLGLALTRLRAVGIEVVDVLPISVLAALPPQGARWRSEGIDCVIAAGGDGLLGGVVGHVVPVGLPLGILPLGTGNDVARSVGIPMDIERAVAVICEGRWQKIDIGIASPDSTMQGWPVLTTSEGMYFLHALTVGFNVQFARTATRLPVRRRYGPLTYPYAIYQTLRRYKRIHVSIEFEDLVLQGEGSTIARKSAVLHGHVVQISVVTASVPWGLVGARLPGASLHDRVLDIVVVEDGFWQDLRYRLSHWLRSAAEEKDWHARFPELLPAELASIPGVHHVQARGVKISTGDHHRGVTLDGEVRGTSPVYARIAPNQLCLLTASSTS
jgi:diacylglycerol kinase (ATP)